MQVHAPVPLGAALGAVRGNDIVVFNHLTFIVLVNRLHDKNTPPAARKAGESTSTIGGHWERRHCCGARRHVCVESSATDLCHQCTEPIHVWLCVGRNAWLQCCVMHGHLSAMSSGIKHTARRGRYACPSAHVHLLRAIHSLSFACMLFSACCKASESYLRFSLALPRSFHHVASGACVHKRPELVRTRSVLASTCTSLMAVV